MSEQMAGTPEREAMLRRRMLEALAGFVGSDEDKVAFADGFVRMSRPPGVAKPAQADLFG